MGQRSCQRGILVALKRRLCCAVFLAWLCASFGQVQTALLGITPCWGTIPLTWARGAGSPHTSTAEQHVPGQGLRGSSAASPHGAAPHGAWAALCTGASSGEGDRDTDKVRDRQRYNGRCRCGLQPLARPSSRAAPLGFRHLKQLLGACSCVPLSCQPAAAPCKFFHPVKLGS